MINGFIDVHEFHDDEKVSAGSLSLPAYKKHVLDIEYENTRNFKPGQTVYNKSMPLLPFGNSDVFRADIVYSRCLTGPIEPNDNCKAAYEVTFDVKDSNFKFKAGDTIGVIPENRDDDVEFIISHLGLGTLAGSPYTLSVASGQTSKIPAHIPVKSSIRHVLKFCVDLRSVMKKLFLLALSKYTENERERRILEYFSSTEGAQYYREYVLNHGNGDALCITKLFKVFKSCKPPVEVLLSYLPRLLPRPYSIVNSGLNNSNIIKICFSVLSSLEKGLTTGWIEKMVLDNDFTNQFRKLGIQGSTDSVKSIGNVPIYLRTNVTRFSLPENMKNPLVMIAIGTGVSPFLGFLEELEIYKSIKLHDVTDDVWLFFGCRDPEIDYIYEKELNGFRKRGVLKELNVAFSCMKNVEEKHVQDSLKNNSVELTSLIESSATLFVCGDLEIFAKTIKDTLKVCLVTSGKTEDEAVKMINDMDKEKRFIVDSWT